jgi:hypothetical protein
MRWIILLSLFFGCSGYRFSHQENPLKQYGIQSLAVPMFYNFSNIPDVSGEFSRETYKLLTGFSGLKLVSGYSESADAVLIGIIRSEESLTKTLTPLNLRVAKNQAPNSVGDKRQNFYIPGTSILTLTLQVIVIKKPTEEELALLRSGIGEQVISDPKSRIIFNERLPLRGQFAREIFDNAGTSVVATQNAGVQRRTIRTLAETAAVSVRDMILYAF